VRKGIAIAALLATSIASAQEKGRYFIEVWGGRSIVPFLGSEDTRTARGYGLGFTTKPRWLVSKGADMELFVSAYFHDSSSPGASGKPANKTDAFGALMLLRNTAISGPKFRVYTDIGVGLNLSDQRTVDLSSRLTATPTIGLMFGVPTGRGQEFYFGARLMHLSNAGTAGNNQGNNQLLFVAQYRF
jgi:Lipid A 3-O-deacylase (PagL)